MKAAITIVEQEIDWHGRNRGDSTQGANYERGFRKGLEHIKDLLEQADRAGEEDEGEIKGPGKII